MSKEKPLHARGFFVLFVLFVVPAIRSQTVKSECGTRNGEASSHYCLLRVLRALRGALPLEGEREKGNAELGTEERPRVLPGLYAAHPFQGCSMTQSLSAA